MTAPSALFRGTTTAAAVIVDPDYIGVTEARRRVMALGTGTALVLPDGRWLVLPATPITVRSELAPGQVLVADGNALAVPGLPAEPGRVTWLAGGELHRAVIRDLPAVPTDGWVDLGDLPRHSLTPLDETEPEPQRPAEPVRPDPDLRVIAGLRERDDAALRRLAAPSGRLADAGRVIARSGRALVLAFGVLAGLALLAGALFLVVGGAGDSRRAGDQPSPGATASAPRPMSSMTSGPSWGSAPTDPLASLSALISQVESQFATRSPDVPATPGDGFNLLRVVLPAVGVLVVVRVLARLVRGHGTHTGAQPAGRTSSRRPRRRTRRGWLSRLLLRPASGYLARRQLRYLTRLTRQFERREWHDLLSDGIGLSAPGTGGDWLRLRMPGRRESLRLRTSADGDGPATVFGENAYAYLRRLYEQAARTLEEAGDLERATFVHAELLRDVPAAVAMLERQGRFGLAAELAEGRLSDAGLAVRLWWRAGERDEAVRVARAQGAYAEGVTRLEQVDAGAAVELREAWIMACRAAGDHLGAVRAAWPVPALRARSRGDIDAGSALGGEVEGQLLGYRLAAFPAGDAADRAVALLDSGERSTRSVRHGLIVTLADEGAGDPAVERRVCSAAVRSVTRGDTPPPVTRGARRRLAERADPLVRADLAHAPARTRAPVPPPDPSAPDEPGRLPVHDAAALPRGAVLAAHGQLGVRLYGPDGRTRARWDVPADQLVVADNGASALLVRRAGSLLDVHRLDLLSRRVRHWALLRARLIATSYDGVVAVVVDDDGIAFFDTLSDAPRVLWRELDAATEVFAVNRTADRLTAIVGTRGQGLVELWVWELSSQLLRVRRRLDLTPELTALVTADAAALLRTDDGDGDAKLACLRGHDRPVVTPIPSEDAVSADDVVVLLQRPVGSQLLATLEVPDQIEPLHVTFPVDAGRVAVHARAGTVTLHDDTGRIVALDGASGEVLASFATRA